MAGESLCGCAPLQDAGFDPLALGKGGRLLRQRELEVLAARWAMLGATGLVVQDLLGGGPADLLSQRAFPAALVALTAAVAGEAYRAAAAAQLRRQDLDARVYPGLRRLLLRWQRGGGGSSSSGPGLGVFAAWLGGLPGWLSGGWWYERRELTRREMESRKEAEIKHGRLAM